MNDDSAVVRLFSAKRVKAACALLLLVCTAAFVPASHADSLHYFKNYFVTGDYTVAGVGLFGKGVNGTATGTINMTTVPGGADIVAAFLYWQTVEMSAAPSTINGVFDGNPIVGEALGNPSTASCWSQGGTSPQTSARVYRADVLRYFTNIDPVNHVRLVNGNHTVKFPDSGSTLMSVLPHTEGATLVVVYRMLQAGAASYKSVVMFDGSNTLSKFGPAFSQTLGGFYDAAGPDAKGNPTAKMTEIVGNGQPNFAVGLTVGGKTPAGVTSTEFDGAAGTRWDNPTFAISLAQGASSVTTQVSPGNNQVCLTWGAILMSTDVENTDGDGNLNSWKLNGMHFDPGKAAYPNPVPATFGDCITNPKNCENFKAMGAVLGTPLKPHPDVFVQIDWLERTDGPAALTHIHAPKFAALQMIYNVFQSHGIYVHFDVGNRYQFNPPKPFVIPGPYAKGGNVVQESTLFCPNAIITDYTKCEYVTAPSAPGGLGYLVSGWKIGLDAFKNGFPILKINNPLLPPDRKDTFRYAVFGHALGGPSDPITGKPLSATPPSSSGVADLLGGDILVTLGLWSGDNPTPGGKPCTPDDPSGTVPDGNLCIDQTGTSLQQAGTLMHELGHTLGLRHGGGASLPNCMPIYPSVMNYLYQTRGLTDQFGNENIDYSLGMLNPLNENGLYENQSLGSLKYRIRYYARASKAELAAGSEAKAHCDGSSTLGANEVREEAPWGQTPDWDNDGDQNSPDGTAISADINFNGSFTDVMNDYKDWANLNLRQVGARSNVGGLSVEVGPLDLGSTDLGPPELGQTELGRTELGQTELGQTELGQTELGQTELGQTELGEVDYSAAISSLDATGPINAPANDPNGLLEASLASDATLASSGHPGSNEVVLNWGGPSLGQIRTFNIWRTNTTLGVIAPQNQTVPLGSVSAVGAMPPTTFTDKVNDFSLSHSGANCPNTNTCYNATYQYFITAEDTNATISNASNFVTATVYHIFVTPVTAIVTYGNPNPDLTSSNPNIVTAIGPAAGALAASAFTCTWAGYPAPPRNAAPLPGQQYPTSCSGPPTAGTNGVYGVSYNADSTGTLTIIPRPLYIDATTNSKVYDSTVSPVPATVVPSIEATIAGVGALSGSGLVNGDTVTGLAEVYQSPNVTDSGSKTLVVCAPPTPAVCPSSYTVNDLNGGSNYTVTTKTAAGTITPRPATWTTNSNSKTYGNADPIPLTTGSGNNFVAADNVTATYSRVPGETVLGGPYPIMATLSPVAILSNYSITNAGANFTINTRPVTWTTNPNSKTYGDLDPSPLTTGSGTNFVAADGVTATYSRVAGETVLGGPYLITATLSPAAVLSNYSITNGGASFTINTRPATWTTNPNSKTYGDLDPSPLTTGSGTNFVAADGVTATYSRAPGSTVSGGPYAITATLGPAAVLSNYNITNAGNSFTITPAILSVVANSQTKVYGQTDPLFTFVAAGFKLGDAAGTVLTGGLNRVVGENANTTPGYAINQGTLAANTNYAVGFTGNYLTITQRPLIIDAAANVKVYDGTTSATISPLVEAATSGTGLAGSDSVSGLAETYASSNASSSDTLSVSHGYAVNDGNGGNNYSVTLNTAIGVITLAPLTLTVSESGMAPSLLFTPAYSGFVHNETSSLVTGTLSCTQLAADGAGNIPISCSGLSAPNYNISYSFPYSSEMLLGDGTAPLTVAVNGTQTYGGTPTLTLTYSGFVGNDSPSVVTGTLTCSTNGTSTSAVGAVLIVNNDCAGLTATSLTPGTIYKISYAPGTVTVIAAPLIVTVTGSGQNFTVGSYVGFIGQDNSSNVTGTLSCAVDATPDTAGNTPISCSGLQPVPNYYALTYSYAFASVGVSPAPLTISVNGAYNGGNPIYTPTYSGLMNGDLPSVVVGTLSCSFTGLPGNFTPSSCSGLSAPTNYTINYWIVTVTGP